MSNLKLVTTEKFGEIDCNFYRNMNDEILLTREQIGSALEYSNPSNAIKKIHFKHKDRLENLCLRIKNPTVPKMGTLDSNLISETIYYSQRGIMEICRWSRQPKANQFMDWVWDIIEKYRNGTLDNNIMANVTNLINENNKILISTILSMQEQSLKTNELLITLLNNNQPKEMYKSNYMPAWISKMFPTFMVLKEFYYPEDSGYTNTYRKIFNEFNEAYGSELLAQTADDFCYKNNCKKCNTMDAIAYSPDIRKAMEVIIDNMLLEVNNVAVNEATE